MHPSWQTLLMNVLLDKQEWQSKDGSTVAAARIQRLRIPEMPVPSAGWHTVRSIGVPGNVAGNYQSSGGGFCQATLTQPSRSPPVAAATAKRKTGH